MENAVSKRAQQVVRRFIVAAWTVMLSAAVAASAGAQPRTSAAAQPAISLTPPSADAFYTPPPGFGADAPGTLLRSRLITGDLDSASASATYQLLYVTEDNNGKKIATVTTVLIPRTPTAGPRRLVSYQYAEDALTTACAPSYAIQNGATGGTMADDAVQIAQLLGDGWDVVMPDYEGPDSEWLNGPLEGHATLDSIRAAESFSPAWLPGAQTLVASVGYSGGSDPTMWAADMASSYAPEITFSAVTAGGITADLDNILSRLDGGLYYGAGLLAMTGVDRGYPQLNLSSLLTPAGITDQQADLTGCGHVLGDPGGTTATDYKVAPDTALAADPQVKDVLDQINLAYQPASPFPTFIYNIVGDDAVRVEGADAMVSADCAAGTIIDYDRDPVGDHASGYATYYPPAFAYIKSRFDGATAPDTCPTPSGRGDVGSLRVAVSPSRAALRHKTTFHVTVTIDIHGVISPAPNAQVLIGNGRYVRTNPTGHATTTFAYGRNGQRHLVATAPHYASGTAQVRVTRTGR